MSLALLGASTALAIVMAPYQLTARGFAPAAAFAEDGEGSDHDGGESSDHDGGESSDHDSDGDSSDSDSGESESDGGDDSSDRSGDDDSGDDNRDGEEHVNSATGDKVEIDGSNIEVEHPDGIKEEIEDGRYEMKDASGRTIVERPATDADRARLEAMAG
jgi:hypothetical protein